MIQVPEPPTIEVGGIPVTPFAGVEPAAEAILGKATGNGGFALAINAEKVVRVKSEPEWCRIVEAATTCYADGAPIAWTLRRRGAPEAARIPGVELWERIMTLAGERRIPVYLVGARPHVLDRVVQKLKREHDVAVVGSQHGYFDNADTVISDLASSKARIVSVALGTPSQERFILAARQALPDALYLGVGGTYDVFGGAVPRAPQWFRDHGLEWLYRVAREPTRLRRQLNLAHYVMLHLGRRI